MTENKQNNQNQVEKKITRQQLRNRKVKQGTSIGGKWIIIGIGLFFLIIILIIFFFFFYLTAHPEKGKAIGIGPSAIKSITFIFAGLLFGSLFILFLILGLIYIYKFLTKDTDKLKNGIGVFIVFILGVTNLVFGGIVFLKINKINTNDIIKTKNVLISYINFMDKNNPGQIEYIPMYKNNYPLIAPITISFQLNTKAFKNNYYNKLILNEGSINPIKFVLDCGNGKILEYPANYAFSQNKYCLYLHKGTYNISFKFIYRTRTKNNAELQLPGKTINIISEVTFKSPSHLNANKNEIIVGEKTDTVKLDLSKIPTDLSLLKNTIDIDFEGQNKFKKLAGIAKHTYNKDGKFYIVLRLPDKEEYPYYTFPVRVLPSTKPTCSISSENDNGIYTFKVKGDSPNGAIKQYIYKIKNLSEGKIIGEGKGQIVRKNLKNGSDYQIFWYITDTKGNIGSCGSDIIRLSLKRDYKYNIKVYDKDGKEIQYKNNKVIINTIPKTLTLQIGDIIGGEDNITDIGFDTDNDGHIDKKTKKIEITIKKNTQINTIIKDIYGNKSVKNLLFKIDLKKVIAHLTVNKYKGEVPLKVKFDASTSKVTEKDDNIIYFNWDFGDGEKIENTRQGIIEHIYKKPGTYIAKVKVETEKGYEDTSIKKIFVYKSIPTANIIFPENLGGQIEAGISLKIELESSGNIRSIEWDFGDGNTFKCDGRECKNVSHIYKKKGLYTIQAKVNYLDGSPSTKATATINVIE